MALSMGIVGLPNVGKSTIFNALTNKKAESSNYPFCTINPNVGVVKVPDSRLSAIAKISNPKKIVPTTMEFIDIAGIVKGAHKGEGLGNKFLANIRECDAICEVIREFKDDNIVHVNGKIDPEEDAETISLELIFADLASLKKANEKAVKDAKDNSKEKADYKNLLQKIIASLEKGIAIRNQNLTAEEKKLIKHLNLLTIKPILYILNSKNYNFPKENLEKKLGGKLLLLDAKLEEEISKLPEAEQKEYINELELNSSGLDKLIQKSYELLGLVSFFTTGPDETRAWTIKKGSKAPVAAGVIHSDFEKGFIRAEVIEWKTFIENKGEQSAREKGLVKTEGKDYIMKDGDICNFLFNN